MSIKKRQAQSALEYVFLLCIVVAAIILMAIYIGRGFKGSFRSSADQQGEQYELRGMTTNTTQTTVVVYNTSTPVAGSSGQKIIKTRTTTNTIYEGSERTRAL